MKDFEIKGFPDVAPEVIELPNIAELIVQPMWAFADAEDIRKHGTDLQRYILDKTPLQHDRKYVHATFNVTLLYPRVINVPNKFWKGLDGEWHRDGKVDLFSATKDRCYLLQTDCEVLTEFNEHPITLQIPDNFTQEELVVMLNMNPEVYGIKGRKMPPNQFLTLTDHFHRVVQATHHQFRYFVRIIESDTYLPKPYPECLRNDATVSLLNGVPKNTIKNFEKYPEARKFTFYY